MGYYIQTKGSKGKAGDIAAAHSGLVLDRAPDSYDSVPADMAIICVVDNGPFEAAGFCSNKAEFEQFAGMADGRPRTWVLMDRQKAEELSGYRKEQT